MRTRQIAAILLAFLVPAFAVPAAEATDRNSSRSETTVVANAAARTLELINRERSSAGLPALTLDDEVTGIAAGWSPKMAADGELSHNGEYLSEASMKRLDATRVAENVAVADSIEEIHSLFMDSPPHRANILHADLRQIGVAAVRTSEGSIYLTEDFLTRRNGSSAAAEGKQKPGKRPPAKKSPRERGVKRRR